MGNPIGTPLNTAADGQPNFSGPSGTHKRTPDGSIWIVDEEGNWYLHSGLAMPIALFSTSVFLGADVNMTNANEYYDGPEIELQEGEWIVFGAVTVASATDTAQKVTAKLFDLQSETVLASGEATVPSGGVGVCSIALFGKTPMLTTENNVVAQIASTAAGGKIKAAAPDNAAGNTASYLYAVKIVTPV